MKLIPKNLFKSHKAVSRSQSSSFNSSLTNSSNSPDSSHHHSKSTGITTPTSVLPHHHQQPIDIQFELLQAFQIIDTDNDGRITRSQLQSLLTQVSGAELITPDELTSMVNEIDTDGDGCISLEEFSVISSVFGPPSCDEEIRGAFEFFDTDRDGKITADELFAVFKSIGDGECTLDDCRRMINSVDKNGDGFVCFQDFTTMMEHNKR
ncbi:hypothetical protein QVD17_15765 [Tagetes erecta]|uniref:EF-hand domain-containing protein n=1 Tax=Tagetes erecta TaxID=13708 RepID=A0AAD8NZW9_TARER|nr:hypothetical protein QVD17_15765 [Tagetes erecta]